MRKIKYIIAGISAAVFMVSCELDKTLKRKKEPNG